MRGERQPLSRRRVRQGALVSCPSALGKRRPRAAAFLSALTLSKTTLSVAAIQASIRSPDRSDAVVARAKNLETVLMLLEKVQSCGGHKDICLFPVLPLPGDAIPVLLQAARRHACTIVYGSEGLSAHGARIRLTTTIPPNGDVRIEHGMIGDVSVLALRTRNGIYRAVACAADAWYPGEVGLITAIHSPDGRPIVATRSRGEQAVAAVLHVSDASHTGVPS